jgi:hypothetical protein
LNTQSQARLQAGAVASCMLQPVHMLLPVQCGSQCNETGVHAVNKRHSITDAKHCFFDVTHQRGLRGLSISTSAGSVWSNSFTTITATCTQFVAMITVLAGGVLGTSDMDAVGDE